MVSLKTLSKEFVIVSSSNVLFTAIDGESFTSIPVTTKDTPEENVNKELIKQIEYDGVCAEVSPDGTLLAVCSKRKLTLISLKDSRELLSSRQISRAASKVRFLPSGRKIVIADKSGDVYLFSAEDVNCPGTLLLGHLSVILDVLVSKDEKFILTCDRDEKIRVSHFPNAYNIYGFCLGHSEFVSCIEFLPSDPNVLVSGSGDGTVKLWKWRSCKEVYSLSLKSVSSQIEVDCISVTSILFLPQPHNDDYLFVTVSGISGVLFFRTLTSPNIDISLLQFLVLPGSPVCLSSYLSNLFVLSNSKDSMLKKFTFDSSKVKMNGLEEDCLKSEEHKNEILAAIEKDKSLNLDHLFKKRYDNVQEYLEKKKARIGLTK